MAGVRTLNPSGLATPTASYSQGAVAGPWVAVAGQVGVGADGKPAAGIEAQTRQMLENVKRVLEATGLGLDDVFSTTVYLTDMANYKGFDRVYGEIFGAHRPPRATVKADLVHPALLVEVQALAWREAPAGQELR